MSKSSCVCLVAFLLAACSSCSWGNSARILQQDAVSQTVGLSSSGDNTTAVVVDTESFVSALLDSEVRTIYIDRNIVLNGTWVLQRLNESDDYDVFDGVVVITRNLTIAGRSSSGSLNVLDFNLTGPFLNIFSGFTVDISALRVRGIFYLLDQHPRFISRATQGALQFTNVFLERPACRPPDEMFVSSGGMPIGPDRARRLLSDSQNSTDSSPSADSSDTQEAEYGYFDGDAGVIAVENCTYAFASDEVLGYDCIEFAIPDQMDSILNSGTDSDKMGETGVGDLVPSKRPYVLQVGFNRTFLRCGLMVPRNCSQQSGADLEACVQALLDARKARPPPTPLPVSPPAPPLPSAPPSQPSPSLGPPSPWPSPSAPTPPSPSPEGRAVGVGAPSGSSTVLLAAVIAPTVIGSLLLGCAVAGGIVWFRRSRRRGAGDGAAREGPGKKTLQPVDSDQLPPPEGPNGGAAVGVAVAATAAGAAKGGKAAAGGSSPIPTSLLGKGRRRVGPNETPVSVASGMGTLSSQGLSSTLTGLMSSPGLSPNGSGETDATRSITLHYMLGAGSYGRVYYGTWQSQPVAVKIIPHSDAANTKVQQEVALCTRFNHPNVVRSLHYASFEAAPEQQHLSQPHLESLRTTSTATASTPGLNMETWIVLEYCDGGSLASHLNIKATALSAAALQPGPSGGPGALCGQESGVSAGPAAGPGLGSAMLTSPEGSLIPPNNGQRDAVLTKLSAVLSVGRDIAAGMAYLHSLNVCHGDLKCENVLLCYRTAVPPPGSPDDPQKATQGVSSAGGAAAAAAGSATGPFERSSRSTTSAIRGGAAIADSAAPFVAKVADFGLSKAFSEVSTHMSTATVGTVTHMCPVLLLTGQMRPSCDVFSFGILLWQLITGGTPFAGMRYAEIVYKVAVAGMRPEFPSHVPRRLVAMAESCWAADPTTRPTFDQLVSELEVLLAAVDELEAEQEASLHAARDGGDMVQPEDVSVKAFSAEDAAVASQWAAAAAAALLE